MSEGSSIWFDSWKLGSGGGQAKARDAARRSGWRRGAVALGLGVALGAACLDAHAQLDPESRRLIQLGYNQPVEGQGPLAAYGFFYLNDPSFLRTNITLRLAVAPIYLDSELGLREVLPRTDLGFSLAGGGFADSYAEVRGGKYWKAESFTGHGVDPGLNVYHRFNPSQEIPLYGIARVDYHESFFEADDNTASNFQVPDQLGEFRTRVGLRWGGQEPLILPDLALELSAWYEGMFRRAPDYYGYNRDREISGTAHLYWARALMAYTLPESRHQFSLALTAGTSVDADRFSAYRLGGVLPLISEFPLSIPGYYWQELSARRFALLNGQYTLPLTPSKSWCLVAYGATALVDYTPGMDQPGHWNSGVGGGVMYQSPSKAWKVVLGYGYGIDAIRSHGRGANSIGLLCQFDLEASHDGHPSESSPSISPRLMKSVNWLLGR